MEMSYCETFLQVYVEQGQEITCYWGIQDGAMSFLVIDLTNGLADDASFRLQAGDEGNRGVLATPQGERYLNGTGIVVQIGLNDVTEEAFSMTETQLNGYLSSGDFPLDIAGVRSYVNQLGC